VLYKLLPRLPCGMATRDAHFSGLTIGEPARSIEVTFVDEDEGAVEVKWNLKCSLSSEGYLQCEEASCPGKRTFGRSTHNKLHNLVTHTKLHWRDSKNHRKNVSNSQNLGLFFSRVTPGRADTANRFAKSSASAAKLKEIGFHSSRGTKEITKLFFVNLSLQ
jgi:hypothetical protein